MPSSLADDVAGIKAENAALREQLRRVEEQQKTLMDVINRLQQRLDGTPVTVAAQPAGPTRTEPQVAPASAPHATVPQATQAAASTADVPTEEDELTKRLGSRYDDGIVVARSSEDSRVPFLLKLNDVTQFRYTNTQPANNTFTDHLGAVHSVEGRNDFGINRNLLRLNGYIFDKRLQFDIITWASNSLATVIAGGELAFRFNKAVTLNVGYWTVPGSRTLTQTFPYFTQLDRSMADNFFRPGFTQGIWAVGEPVDGLHYHVFIGNGLNTLTIPTAKIDRNLVYSGSTWWEPLGPYGPPGKGRNMYDDYESHNKVAIRLGTSYTRSREDRFSNLDQRNPENTSLYNSDGVLTFATGAFAPNVTLQEATYRMWAVDGGVKWRGLAFNGQHYTRWLDSFQADGPLPINPTFDHGFETSLSAFVVPRKWELYGRTSYVFGQFGNSHEYAGGFKWYPVRDYRVWLNGEALRVYKTRSDPSLLHTPQG